MSRQVLVAIACGLLGLTTGCGQMNGLRSGGGPSLAPDKPEGFARQLVHALATRNKDAFMARVISIETMTEILEEAAVPEDQREKMLAEVPDMIGKLRGEHARYYDHLIDAGDVDGVRWGEAIFTGVEVLKERADSGTMTRELAIGFKAGGTAYTMTAEQCISIEGEPIYLLSELKAPISEAAARAAEVLLSVKTVYSAAMAYKTETDEFPADISELIAEGFNVPAVDAWGTELSAWSTGTEVQICSAGPDTTHGSHDDICAPEPETTRSEEATP